MLFSIVARLWNWNTFNSEPSACVCLVPFFLTSIGCVLITFRLLLHESGTHSLNSHVQAVKVEALVVMTKAN